MPPPSTLITKLKVQLKLSISRLRMVQQKDTAIAKQQRRAMAQLLEQGKLESARIRVENIIRSDLTTELLEILELYCELLLARAGLLADSPANAPDPGLEEAVVSLVYAAPRTEIKELHNARALLCEKFGKEFSLAAAENKDGKVAKRVLDRLRVEPPSEALVEGYLTTIAQAYGVDYPPGSRAAREAAEAGEDEDAADGDDDDDEPSSGQKVPALETPLEAEDLSRATPPRDLGPRSPVRVAPPKMSTENPAPALKLPGPPGAKPGSKVAKASSEGGATVVTKKKDSGAGPGGAIPDVDELAKRFAQLKR